MANPPAKRSVPVAVVALLVALATPAVLASPTLDAGDTPLEIVRRVVYLDPAASDAALRARALDAAPDDPPATDDHNGIICLPEIGPIPILCPPHQCEDGEDNDGDGYTDYPDDPGCDYPEDDDEYEAPACSDGWDNDGDGLTDYPSDPGCYSSSDTNECNYGGVQTGHVQISTTGGPYGTSVSINVYWKSNGEGCAGDPIVLGASYSCSWFGGWSNTACVGDNPTGGGGAHGTFSCGASWCSGAVSPHNLGVQGYPFEEWGGGLLCVTSHTVGIPSGNVVDHCHIH